MKRRAFVLVSILSAVAASGCVRTSVDLVAFSPMPPALQARRVAVLPTQSQGVDASASIAIQDLSDRVLSTPLGGVRFLPASEAAFDFDAVDGILDQLRASTASLREGRPPRVEGDARLLIGRGGSSIDGLHRRTPAIRLRQRGPSARRIFPASLEPSLFADVDADYVLASVAASRFRMDSDIYAAIGLLPFMIGESSSALPPLAAWALYDVRSGERVWEALLGTSRRPNASIGDQINDPIDPRAHAVIGVAYLLAGEPQRALDRAIEGRVYYDAEAPYDAERRGAADRPDDR